MNDIYEVTFYFSSGEVLRVDYTKEQLKQMYNLLKANWNSCCITSEEFGINFSKVTHYKVKK